MQKHIDIVWNRILQNEGNTFHLIRGQEFTYIVQGAKTIYLPSVNWNISKSQIEKALAFVPLTKVSPLQHLQAPSYQFALLTDERIMHDLV